MSNDATDKAWEIIQQPLGHLAIVNGHETIAICDSGRRARQLAAVPVLLAALKGICEHAEQEIADWAAEVATGREINATELRRWNAVIAALAKARGDE